MGDLRYRLPSRTSLAFTLSESSSGSAWLNLYRNDFGSRHSVCLVVKKYVPPTFSRIHFDTQAELLLSWEWAMHLRWTEPLASELFSAIPLLVSSALDSALSSALLTGKCLSCSHRLGTPEPPIHAKQAATSATATPTNPHHLHIRLHKLSRVPPQMHPLQFGENASSNTEKKSPVRCFLRVDQRYCPVAKVQWSNFQDKKNPTPTSLMRRYFIYMPGEKNGAVIAIGCLQVLRWMLTEDRTRSFICMPKSLHALITGLPSIKWKSHHSTSTDLARK